jgi:uncharacterized protein YndB with AHSA1/START domain
VAAPGVGAQMSRRGDDRADVATVSLPSDSEIVITRIFRAPRPAVFDAWTRAEHVAQWWDPSGQPLAVCEIDLRPGGAFRFVPRGPEGSTRTFTGRYREIVPHSRLVFASPSASGAESIGRLVFDEHDHLRARGRGGTTTLTLTIACASREDRDFLLRMRVDAGTVQTLDNLERHLAASGSREEESRWT